MGSLGLCKTQLVLSQLSWKQRRAKLSPEGLATQPRMVERGMWPVGRVFYSPEERRVTEPKTPSWQPQANKRKAEARSHRAFVLCWLVSYSSELAGYGELPFSFLFFFFFFFLKLWSLLSLSLSHKSLYVLNRVTFCYDPWHCSRI